MAVLFRGSLLHLHNLPLGGNVMGRRVTPFTFVSTTLSAAARERTEAEVRFNLSAMMPELRPSEASLRSRSSSEADHGRILRPFMRRPRMR